MRIGSDTCFWRLTLDLCLALTATPEGQKCFDRLGFEATGYQEVWVKNSHGNLELRTVLPGQSEESGSKAGDADVVSTAQMVFVKRQEADKAFALSRSGS